jgi:predicted ATP-binding protein involved in virulence
MEQVYITNIEIENVRHLRNIEIPLSYDEKKHLILTGKNGSGKTSLIEAMANNLENMFTNKYFNEQINWIKNYEKNLEDAKKNNKKEGEILKLEKELENQKNTFERRRSGVNVELNIEDKNVWALKDKYHIILAYYKADRVFSAAQPKHVEKIKLKENYGMQEFPRHEFVKYLLDLKMTEALARNNDKIEKADAIHKWFEKFENLLKQIFDDQSVALIFDEENFEFHISQKNKESFDFHTLSSGYQAVLDIVLDLIMRMENQTNRSFDFNLSGIVLIDEIETHLHLELQKNIMPLLTTLFPNIQFIVTSHSPFILNSIDNVVIYDLENCVLVKDGLQNVPYDGIVEGYFGANKLSNTLEEKFEKYKSLAAKNDWSDDEVYEIQQLEFYLDEIPDYLALNIATEYQRLKLQIMERMENDG